MTPAELRDLEKILRRRHGAAAARLIMDHSFGAPAKTRQAIDAFIAGDLAGAKEHLRLAIRHSGGAVVVGNALGIGSKSLLRMVGPGGNPRAENLAALFAHLQHHSSIRLKASVVEAPPMPQVDWLGVLGELEKMAKVSKASAKVKAKGKADAETRAGADAATGPSAHQALDAVPHGR